VDGAMLEYLNRKFFKGTTKKTKNGWKKGLEHKRKETSNAHKKTTTTEEREIGGGIGGSLVFPHRLLENPFLDGGGGGEITFTSSPMSLCQVIHPAEILRNDSLTHRKKRMNYYRNPIPKHPKPKKVTPFAPYTPKSKFELSYFKKKPNLAGGRNRSKRATSRRKGDLVL